MSEYTPIIDPRSPIEVVNGRRLYSQLTAYGNSLVGRIDYWLTTHPGYHPPSKVARGCKVTTHEAEHVLSWLDRKGMYAVGDGNGCWRKYAARR